MTTDDDAFEMGQEPSTCLFVLDEACAVEDRPSTASRARRRLPMPTQNVDELDALSIDERANFVAAVRRLRETRADGPEVFGNMKNVRFYVPSRHGGPRVIAISSGPDRQEKS